MLDLGCGSGVLGLAALGLGADRLVAVDLKPSAVEATRRNATLNGLAGRVDAELPPLEVVDGRFDVIVANVGRSVAVESAAALVQRLGPDGWLGVSGISPAQVDQVGAFLDPLVQVGRTDDGDWSAAVFARPTAHPRRSRTCTMESLAIETVHHRLRQAPPTPACTSDSSGPWRAQSAGGFLRARLGCTRGGSPGIFG